MSAVIYLKETNHHMGGIQKVYEFPNGYGASVIKLEGSYGFDQDKWELAVLLEGVPCYSTDITSDVIGHLNDPEVDRLLGEISRLEVDTDA